MATVGADAWRRSDVPSAPLRSGRAEYSTLPPSSRGPRSGRPPVPPRPRSADGADRGRPVPGFSRGAEDRSRPRRDERWDPADRGGDRADGRGRDRSRPAGSRGSAASGRRAEPLEAPGGLRGVVAVLAVFLVTLAGAGIDSFLSTGLGLVTLLALAVSTAGAAFLVRRRDLPSVLVAPPLVFVLVAAVNIALAPSASLNLATVGTLLIRGFPAMAVAVVAGLVVAVLRLASRR